MKNIIWSAVSTVVCVLAVYFGLVLIGYGPHDAPHLMPGIFCGTWFALGLVMAWSDTLSIPPVLTLAGTLSGALAIAIPLAPIASLDFVRYAVASIALGLVAVLVTLATFEENKMVRWKLFLVAGLEVAVIFVPIYVHLLGSSG